MQNEQRSGAGSRVLPGQLCALVVMASLCVVGSAAQVQETDRPPGAQDAVDGQGPSAENAASDPPFRAVRLSVVQGEVSTQPASVNSFSPAELNHVLTSGDRVYTDAGAAAELQVGQIAARLGGRTDLTVTAMTDQLAQFGLASGSVHVRSFAIPDGTVLEVDSPEIAVTVLQPGDIRVDEDAATHATTVAVVSGQVQVDGPGLSQQMNAGDRVRIHGGDPDEQSEAYAEPLPQNADDALDAFSDRQDGLYANGTQGSGEYLNPDTTGSADLGEYGSWNTDLDFGPVWFPTVAVGWRPYCDGHWRWVAPWGWTWVGHEPWGFAPFHYGRWAFINGRWGWLPGTPGVRPVYAPALVAFVGGRQFSAQLGYAPGSGVAAWFPLGPREPYQPPYYGSTGYLNRVNASNLYNPNIAEARAFYHQRAVNVFGDRTAGSGGSAGNRSYVNRLPGTVAMSQASFAGGQPVARNQLQIPAGELAQAPILSHPAVSPERWMMVPGPARAVPPQNQHRTLEAAGQGRRGGDVRPSAEAIARPSFVHAQTPPGPRPSFEEQRQAMERREPGRPVAPAEGAEPHRAGGAVSGREVGLRPGGAPATGRPAPAPVRSGGEPSRAAPPAPATPAGTPRK